MRGGMFRLIRCVGKTLENVGGRHGAGKNARISDAPPLFPSRLHWRANLSGAFPGSWANFLVLLAPGNQLLRPHTCKRVRCTSYQPKQFRQDTNVLAMLSNAAFTISLSILYTILLPESPQNIDLSYYVQVLLSSYAR